MPSRSEHIARAEANEQVVLFLQDAHPDWALTAMFHAEMNWVDAVLDGLDDRSIHPRSHAQRGRYISRSPQLAAVEQHYAGLRYASVGARYDCDQFEPADVLHLRSTRYEPVKQACAGILVP
ncbi:MAG TPA: hypothetical protein VK821_20010 [Dehalococcoidia bacterium]|nr:hypothetical protein [Dehalococcoidia bacterium]